MPRPDHRGNRRSKSPLSLEDAFRNYEQKSAVEPTLEGVIEAQQRSRDMEDVSNPDLDPITQAVLDYHVVGRPDPYNDGPERVYCRGDVSKATDLAQVWHEAKDVSSVPLDDDSVIGWIALHPAMTAEAMLALVAKGLTSEAVAIRAWYGLVKPDRPRLIDRYVREELTADEVVAELQKVLTKRAEAKDRRHNA